MLARKKEVIGLLTLFLIITALHFGPWIGNIRTLPDDRSLLAIHNSRADYPVYLDFIKQGLDGKRLVTNSFAIEPHEGSYYFWFFLLLGRVWRFFGVTDAQIAYHGSVIGIGALWFFSLYILMKSVFRRWQLRLLALGVLLYSTSFPKLISAGGSIGWYMTWWTELDPLHRVFFLPHHAAGHILVVVMMILILRGVEKTRVRYILGAIPFGMAAGFVHPPSLIIVLLVLPSYVLLRRRWRLLLAVLAFVVTSSFSLFGVLHQLKRFPIEGWYESLSFAVSMKEYLLALGPVVPLALAGVPSIRKKPVLLLFFLWALLSLAGVEVSRWLLTVPWPILRAVPLSNVRFLQHAVWVPLGILAVNGLDVINNRFGMRVAAVVFFVLFSFTLVGYPSGYQAYRATLPAINDYDAPPAEWWQAIDSLSGLPPGRIFGMQHTSFYVPGLTGRGVYIGREYFTLSHSTKAADVYTFFQGMDSCKAYSLLRPNGFVGVFYGFDEARAGDAVWTYPFLEVYKRFGETVVFRVIHRDC